MRKREYNELEESIETLVEELVKAWQQDPTVLLGLAEALPNRNEMLEALAREVFRQWAVRHGLTRN